MKYVQVSYYLHKYADQNIFFDLLDTYTVSLTADPLPVKIIYLENLMLEPTKCAMKTVA